MKIKFIEPAYEEYNEAIEFYKLKSEGLEKKFILEIDRTLGIIKNYPESFPKFTENTRKAIVSIFPFNLIYSISDKSILIIAVAHQHRKPNYWLSR